MDSSLNNSFPTSQPLSGVVVVEICHSVAGPYGGSILASLGAEVIKVEDPRNGDHARGWGPPYIHDMSCTFQALNRDKKGMVLDLANTRQAAQLTSLILERADVVLQNLRPGSIASKGFGSEDLLKIKPSLIYCNIGAFGNKGPLCEKPGYDPLMQAFGGIMSLTGEEGGGPVRVGPAIIDMGSGMWAAIGILAALWRRSQTGEGSIVDTSLFETAISWTTIQMAGYLANGDSRRPMGSGIADIVPHQAFQTSDSYLMVAAGNDSLFRKLCEVLGRIEWAEDTKFATNDGRVRNRAQLIPMMQAEFLKKSNSQWALLLEKKNVPNAEIQTLAEVAKHPQTLALGQLQLAPDKEMTLPGLALSFNGERPPYRYSAPKFGEHTEDILQEISGNKSNIEGV